MDDIPNLGPKSRQLLAEIGVISFSQLQQRGSIKTYVQAKRSGANVSLNLLWALEGALIGIHWQDVARHHRTRLLLALDVAEKTS